MTRLLLFIITAATAQLPRHFTHREQAQCYVRRYPDLHIYCTDPGGCDIEGLHHHFGTNGRREGRTFGCASNDAGTSADELDFDAKRQEAAGAASFERALGMDRAAYDALTHRERRLRLESFMREGFESEAAALNAEAQCYVDRYSDLQAKFCLPDGTGCDLAAALEHWRLRGKRTAEPRVFGCRAPPRLPERPAPIQAAVAAAMKNQPKVRGLDARAFEADVAKVLASDTQSTTHAQPMADWGIDMQYAVTCFGDERAPGGACDYSRQTSLDVVVSVFDQPAAVVVRAVANAAPKRVAPIRAFLYCKGPNGCDKRDVTDTRRVARVDKVAIKHLPNVGRCDHAYAVHAILQRANLADATLFLKDTTPWHVHLGSMANVLGVARRLPANMESFCARRVGVDLATFELAEYKSEQCKRFGNCYADEEYVRADIRPMGAWLTAHGIARVGPKGMVPNCQGGVFGAGRAALLRAPPASYAALERELAAGNSVEAGHYAERGWFALFGVDAVPPNIRNRVAVYATSYSPALDIPAKWEKAKGWDCDFLFFGKRHRAPRGWRLVASQHRTAKLKVAPHVEPQLAAYDYTLYAEGLPQLRAVADAVVLALSKGASVAVLPRTICCNGRKGDPQALAYEAALQPPRPGGEKGDLAARVAAARQLLAGLGDTAPGMKVYSSHFVLRRTTRTAAAFDNAWLAHARGLGHGFLDVALAAAAAETRAGSAAALLEAAGAPLVDPRSAARKPLRPGEGAWGAYRTWVFVATADAGEEWVTATKRAVVSALENTSLEPVCVFRGPASAPLAKWLREAGVEVIIHEEPAWADRIPAALDSAAGRRNALYSPLYRSEEALAATFLRVDIPLLLDPRKHGVLVLYTDTDVAFLRDLTRADFGGAIHQGSQPLGPWWTSPAAPRHFTLGAETPARAHGNAGVMLMNLHGLRRTYTSFVDWTFSPRNVERGLHFGDYGPGDQGAYAEFYEGAFAVVSDPLFNWRPYWAPPGRGQMAPDYFLHLLAPASTPAVLHFHGPKAKDYGEHFAGPTYRAGDADKAFREAYEQCEGGTHCQRWVGLYQALPTELSGKGRPRRTRKPTCNVKVLVLVGDRAPDVGTCGWVVGGVVADSA